MSAEPGRYPTTRVVASGCVTTPSFMPGAYLTDVKWTAYICGFLPERVTQMRQRKLLAEMYFPRQRLRGTNSVVASGTKAGLRPHSAPRSGFGPA